jgi:transcriptional regulator with GAF, ATPase, and Fis domain
MEYFPDSRRLKALAFWAHGGTIFLDKIGKLSLDMHSRRLRVLQEGEFEPEASHRRLQNKQRK